MKIPKPMFQMSLNPKMETEAILDIFDQIGEYEGWDGELHGVGPKVISNFLSRNTGVTDIVARIQSSGGDTFEGISVYNLLKSCPQNIKVDIVGRAASAASLIAMAGDTVVMHPTSLMMIHNCWTIAMGNAKDFRKLADDMDVIMKSAKQAYLEKAGGKLTEEELTALLDAESYLGADDCLRLGLCDEVTGSDPDEEKENPAPEPVNSKAPTIETKEKTHWFFLERENIWM